MAIKTKTENKTKFETGDVPTQADFADLIDSFADRPPLVDFDIEAIIEIPAGFILERLVIYTDSNQNIKVGTSSGGGQYFDGAAAAAIPIVLDLMIYKISLGTVYINGSTGIHYKAYMR